ncbi:MAG TPA: macro domain-containing protein [Gemmatimonadota bacterium]|nr:macro domain-containing protein [Gemmatimonadota bacterium]
MKAPGKHGLRSIAFPSISTGAYRYPIGKAAPVAVDVVADWLAGHPDELDLVRFVLFGEGDLAVYREALGAP